MNKYNTISLSCPQCGGPVECTVYDFIDAEKDPALASRLINESLFTFACPQCGGLVPVEYTFFYRDSSKKLMFACVPGKSSYDDGCARDILSSEPQANPQNTGFTFRLIRSIPQLVEKINMFSCGRDDRAMELYKVMIKSQAMENDPSLSLLNPVYQVDLDGDESIYIPQRGGGYISCSISQGLLDVIENLLQRRNAPAGYAVIDGAWAEGLLGLSGEGRKK